MLAPVLDFEKETATENYVEKLPEPVQKAIKANKAIEGMSREKVLLALGKPRHKERNVDQGRHRNRRLDLRRSSRQDHFRDFHQQQGDSDQRSLRGCWRIHGAVAAGEVNETLAILHFGCFLRLF